MSLSRRRFSKEFKEAAIRRLDLGASLAEVARACEVHPTLLHRWRQQMREHGAKAFPGMGVRRADEDRIAQLERKVGQQALELDFLRRCLQHVEEQRRLQASISPRSSTSGSRRK
jgi:transposase